MLKRRRLTSADLLSSPATTQGNAVAASPQEHGPMEIPASASKRHLGAQRAYFPGELAEVATLEASFSPGGAAGRKPPSPVVLV